MHSELLLLSACLEGAAEDVAALLAEHPCRLRERDVHGYGPLGVAVFANRPEIVTAILDVEGGAARNREMKYTPLAIAAALGHESIVQLLVERGEKPNKCSAGFRGSPFHAAMWFGELSCAHYLWSLNPSIIDKDTNSPTALELAFEMDRIDCVRWALPKYRARIDADPSFLEDLVRAVVRGGAIDTLACLSENEQNLGAKCADSFQRVFPGNTAVRESCTNGTSSFLRWLITDGGYSSTAEFEVSDGGPLVAPVVHCFELKRLECLAVLVKYGREIDIRRVTRMENGKSETLLFRACMDGDENMIRALISLGADVEEKVYASTCGCTGVPLATFFAAVGKLDVLRLLVEFGGAQLSKSSPWPVIRLVVGEFADRPDEKGDCVSERDSVSEGSALFSACYYSHFDTARWIFATMRSTDTLYKVANCELLFVCFARGETCLASALLKYFPRLVEGTSSAPNRTLLDLAIESGNESLAKSLVSGLEGISLTLERHVSNATILKIASMKDGARSVALVRWLEQKGQTFSVNDMSGLIGIDFFGTACLNGNLELLRYLVDEVGGPWRAKVDSSFNNVKPISWACAGGHLPVVRYLCERGASLFSLDASFNTTLHLAAGKGKSLELIDFIVEAIGDALPKMLAATNWLGRTAMLEAAAPCNAKTGGGSLLFVEKLVSLGAQLDATDKSRNTLVHLGAMSGDLPLLRYCLKRGLSFAHETYRTIGPPHGPVWNTAMHGRIQALDFILDVALPQTIGLSEATFKADPRNIVCLYRLGIYCSDRSARAPFLRHLAHDRGYNTMDLLGGTNLHYECCSAYGRVDALQILVSYMPLTFNWDDEDNYISTVISACENGDLETVKYLFSIGAPKNRTFGPNALTPLMYACLSGHLPLVKYLISQGASPFDTDAAGLTAVDHAQEWLGEEVHTFMADLVSPP